MPPWNGVGQCHRGTGSVNATVERDPDRDPELRARVLEVLRAADASPSWQRMVTEVVAMEAADKARALGNTLPGGLALA